MSQLPTLIFSYRVEDILDEVTKRTSYIGKMRSTDQEPYVVDRLSLTKGEGFMFSEFLEDAVSQTYDWLRAFGRKIPMYDKIVLKYNDRKEVKNFGYEVLVGGKEIELGKPVHLNVRSFNVLSGVPKEIYITFEEISAINRVEGLSSGISGEISYKLYFDDNGNINEVAGHKSIESFDGLDDMSLVVPLAIASGNLVDVKLELTVNVSPLQEEQIDKDTYVEYYYDFGNPNVFDVYQVNVGCTNTNWKEHACKLAVDPRGCVIFILERSCNMDMNMISSIDRNIKEAIVDFIIYKWFEYTNVSESESFYDKFEFYAREAKKGMDSEKNIMQRKYNINH